MFIPAELQCIIRSESSIYPVLITVLRSLQLQLITDHRKKTRRADKESVRGDIFEREDAKRRKR